MLPNGLLTASPCCTARAMNCISTQSPRRLISLITLPLLMRSVQTSAACPDIPPHQIKKAALKAAHAHKTRTTNHELRTTNNDLPTRQPPHNPSSRGPGPRDLTTLCSQRPRQR